MKRKQQRTSASGHRKLSAGHSRPADRLLDAADELFTREGIQSVGIDRVLGHADVAKQSLYDHFGGRDGLVDAYIRRRDDAWWRMIAGISHTDPCARIMAIIDAVEAFVTSPGCTGCVFIAALEEIPDRSHPARARAAAHKQRLRTELATILRGANIERPDVVAEQIALLIDGVLVAARVGNAGPSINAARDVVERLIRS